MSGRRRRRAIGARGRIRSSSSSSSNANAPRRRKSNSQIDVGMKSNKLPKLYRREQHNICGRCSASASERCQRTTVTRSRLAMTAMTATATLAMIGIYCACDGRVRLKFAIRQKMEAYQYLHRAARPAIEQSSSRVLEALKLLNGGQYSFERA